MQGSLNDFEGLQCQEGNMRPCAPSFSWLVVWSCAERPQGASISEIQSCGSKLHRPIPFFCLLCILGNVTGIIVPLRPQSSLSSRFTCPICVGSCLTWTPMQRICACQGPGQCGNWQAELEELLAAVEQLRAAQRPHC